MTSFKGCDFNMNVIRHLTQDIKDAVIKSIEEHRSTDGIKELYDKHPEWPYFEETIKRYATNYYYSYFVKDYSEFLEKYCTTSNVKCKLVKSDDPND